MENPNPMVQSIKTEICEIPNDNQDQADCSSYTSNFMVKQEFSASAVFMQPKKRENSFDDDIDIEATKVTSAYENNFSNYVDTQIKVENNVPNPDQNTLEQMLETEENSCDEQDIKNENILLDLEEQSSASAKETVVSHKLCEIREKNHAKSGNDRAGSSTDKPTSSEATTDDLFQPASQSSVIRSIKLLGENKQYKCDRCEKSFCDRMELKVHKRNHQFTVCPVCKRTMRKDFVKRHIARVHPDAGILPRNRSFPCNECDLVFSNDVQLKNHQLSHKKQDCLVCGKIVRADYLKRHMDLNHPKEVSASDGNTYQCDMCDAVFSNKYVLFFHRRTHQTEECPVCKEILRVGYLKIHIDTKHPDHSTLPENPAFKCEHCERVFGYKAALTLHKRKHRLTECTVCKRTVRTDCLKRHMDFNHLNENDTPEKQPRFQGELDSTTEFRLSKEIRRPQQTDDCPVCKETFRSDYLKIHMALKHPKVGATPEERPFQCDQCDKSFAHKTQLRLHKRNHRMTECTICQKSMRMDCLRLHMSRMHASTSTHSSTQD